MAIATATYGMYCRSDMCLYVAIVVVQSSIVRPVRCCAHGRERVETVSLAFITS